MQTNNKQHNILYIGPYHQADGWGFAARDYILSMLTRPEINLTCQPIFLANGAKQKVPDVILAKENNFLDNYNMIIQHSLPFSMVKLGNIKNVGILFLENQNFNSDSIYNLQTMDEIWVSSELEKQTLVKAGITKPVHKIGHAIPYQQQSDSSQINFSGNIAKNYKFYIIGEYIQRKNMLDVIKAFHLEFDITEPVSLVIKTSNVPMQKIQSDCETIKQSLRIKKSFHSEIIITERLTDQQLGDLHNACDCFVMMSYGEAFCRPIAEALCRGKYSILSSNMGINEDIEHSDYSEVQCIEQPVILDDPRVVGAMDIYNGYESWFVPSITDLRKKMRAAYLQRPCVSDKKKYINKFSYNSVGEKICQLL